MPPEDFLPFMVPFKGGPGPLCGGACTETFQWSIDNEPYVSPLATAWCQAMAHCATHPA
jgi:hypothetical protein